jgi:hypothetical protein
MSFTIYQADGLKVIQYFFNIEELIKAMLNNPHDAYHRNVK